MIWFYKQVIKEVRMINMTRMKLWKLIFWAVLLVFPLYFSAEESEIGDEQLRLLDALPPDQKGRVLAKMQLASDLENEIDEAFNSAPTALKRPKEKVLTEKEEREYKKKSRNWVYGYELFDQSPTSFVPGTEDIPVPEDYVLGPGDKVKIELFGTEYQTVSQYINRSGSITVPQYGPIVIAGLTLGDAKQLITKKISEAIMGTEVFLSLGEFRSINIFILGSAYQPGSYTVSSLSTVMNALLVSGGVNEGGSVRNIQIKRKGKILAIFDLYELFLKGNIENDLRLREGDVIFIPFLNKTARSEGYFNNPNLFELKEGDTIRDLIEFSGGTSVETGLKPKFELSTISDDNKRIRKEFGASSPVLQDEIKDGDTLSVLATYSIKNSVVELKGEFKFTGFYSVSPGERLSSVIRRAGGLTENAYPLGAAFTRESVAVNQKLSFERSADFIEQTIADTLISGSIDGITVDSMAPISNLIERLRNIEPKGRLIIQSDPYLIEENPELDILLQDGDVLFIPKRPNSITVVGEVRTPSTHTFISGNKSTDYILTSGGFKDSADRDGLFLLLPNGESRELSSRKFSKGKNSVDLLPGSTIVVPRDPRPFDWLGMTQTITPIIANAAIEIATISALLDDD